MSVRSIRRFTGPVVILLGAGVLLGTSCSQQQSGGESGEQVGEARQADKLVVATPPLENLDPTCTNVGNHTVRNDPSGLHERGSCSLGDGFTFNDAVTACGGEVKYFSYFCSDFPAQGMRSWTAYFGCCAGSHGPSCGVDADCPAGTCVANVCRPFVTCASEPSGECTMASGGQTCGRTSKGSACTCVSIATGCKCLGPSMSVPCAMDNN